MSKRSLLFAFLLLFLAPVWAFASDEEPCDKPFGRHIRVERNISSETAEITIETQGGQIAWRDLARALAYAENGDPDDVGSAGRELAKPGIDLRKRWVRLALLGADLALGANVDLRVEPARTAADELQLYLAIDRRAIRASSRRIMNGLRKTILKKAENWKTEDVRYGLKLDEGWQEAPIEEPLVIAIHGLFSNSRRVAYLLHNPRREGFPTGSFQYNSRKPLKQACRLLAKELADVAKLQPNRRIALVAHSTGGLVARGVIEDPALDPGNVERLIMIATPNHGSALANFNLGLSIWNYVDDEQRREKVSVLAALAEDTIGSAAFDLRPDSEFLERLNSRPRNPKVSYSLILGNKGFLSKHDMQALIEKITFASSNNAYLKLVGVRAKNQLLELDELVDNKGDGVVAVERGLLKGVEDTLVLPFWHAQMFTSTDSPEIKKLYNVVLNRLSRGRGRQF